MFSCLQLLEAFLWVVVITLMNVTRSEERSVGKPVDEHRHELLRIHGAELRPMLLAAVADEMHRNLLVVETLEVQRDAHAVRRARAPVAVELESAGRHDRPVAESVPPTPMIRQQR